MSDVELGNKSRDKKVKIFGNWATLVGRQTMGEMLFVY